MSRVVKLSRIDGTLETLTYPISRSAAVAELDDVTLEVANGEIDLGDLVADLGSDSFRSVDDLRDELFEYLPEDALGELGHAEGEG